MISRQGKKARVDVTQKKTPPKPRITPGMHVAASQGDLNVPDISAPRVTKVDRDAQGQLERVVVKKGVVFKKTIDVPPDRIEAVTPAHQGEPGEVLINTDDAELYALAPLGTEALADKAADAPPTPDGLLAAAEENLPTVEGLRRRKGRRSRRARTSPVAAPGASTASAPKGVMRYLRALGPGMLAGMAGDDASAVTSYSINGATNGYGQLWLMLLSTPLFQTVQFACGKVGRVSQKGFSVLLRERYGMRVAVPATLILVIANIGLITGDLVAIGSGLQLITGISWVWFMAPTALLLWYVILFPHLMRKECKKSLDFGNVAEYAAKRGA